MLLVLKSPDDTGALQKRTVSSSRKTNGRWKISKLKLTISLVFVSLKNATFLERCGRKSLISTTINPQSIADKSPFKPVLNLRRKGRADVFL